MASQMGNARWAEMMAVREIVAAWNAGGAVVEQARGALPALLLSMVREQGDWPLVVVVPDADSGDVVQEDLRAWGISDPLHFPPWDVMPSETEYPEFETLKERITVLRALHASGKEATPFLMIVPLGAFLQPTIPPSDLTHGEYAVRPGMETSLEALAGRLADAGFERVANIDGPGQFARRGGVVDVFPLCAESAYRIDFFGDEIDSIHVLDVVSQQSEQEVASCVLVDMSTATIRRSVREGATVSLLDYLPPSTRVAVMDPMRSRHHAELYWEGYANMPGLLFPLDEVMRKLSAYPTILFPKTDEESAAELWPGMCASLPSISVGSHSLARLGGSTEHALEVIEQWRKDAFSITVFCHNEAERHRCRDIFRSHAAALAEVVDFRIGGLSSGFEIPDAQWVVMGDHEIFHRYRDRRVIRKPTIRSSPIRDFTEIRPGDYVVHLLHGIGRNNGFIRLEQNGKEGDFLELLFDEGAKLFVPLSHIDMVQRYIGGGDTTPKLSRLGGKAWKRQKEHAEKAVRDVAADLLRVQAVRKNSAGIAFPADNEWQQSFEQSFLYSETEDQLSAIEALRADMSVPVPMDRLLCGDVGFGKTEVAIRAAFRAVNAGYQVAVLVPTTILAEQHFRSFSERMADYPVRVECLSRFRSGGNQREIIRHAAKGQVDILIGTHRLLSQDVQFQNLGLVVVDEEQRFGVEHKERLKALRAEIDVLTMTATPIPRTLHMGLLGLRDISTLTTPPQGRQPIRTHVVRFRDDIIRRGILRELARGGQVFFLHNRVRDIESIARLLRKTVPEARFGVAHGQMHEHELEDAMRGFINHDIDVLIATTIIESGLDIPNANTIFINNADCFGLSQLHQLRGRVGRYRNRAYAYFLTPSTRPINPVSQRRLDAIEEFAGLGSGFQLALRDLEIRGAGNILGLEQSGHIHQIGYELYCRLLERVTRELRGEKVEELEPVELALGVSAFLPESYVNLEEERVELYRDLAACATEDELSFLESRLRDRYGVPPESVLQLFADERFRQRARAVGINHIGKGSLERAVVIGFTEGAMERAVAVLRSYKEKRRAFTPLEGTRFRFGLGYYEEEWDGFEMALALKAIELLEDAGVRA